MPDFKQQQILPETTTSFRILKFTSAEREEGLALIRPVFIWFSWTWEGNRRGKCLRYLQNNLSCGCQFSQVDACKLTERLEQLMLHIAINPSYFRANFSAIIQFSVSFRGYCYYCQSDSTFVVKTPVLVMLVFFFFFCPLCSLILSFLLLQSYYNCFEEIARNNPVEF